MGLKITSKESKFLAAAQASAPASLADQQADATAALGVHEASMRNEKASRRAAMQATSGPRIDSPPTNTTGAVPTFRAIRKDDVKEV